MKYYTGIGSRQTPADVLYLMADIARRLATDGWCVRSGGAEGADTAFYAGANDAFETGFTSEVRAEVYLPWDGFNGHHRSVSGGFTNPTAQAHIDVVRQAGALAAALHPAWEKCSEAARLLHRRNCFQVLGMDLQSASKFLICWTPGAQLTGGTALALRVARMYDVPTFNLAAPEVRDRLSAWVTRR